MSYDYIYPELTLFVIISGEFVAVRLSSVSSAEAISLWPKL